MGGLSGHRPREIHDSQQGSEDDDRDTAGGGGVGGVCGGVGSEELHQGDDEQGGEDKVQGEPEGLQQSGERGGHDLQRRAGDGAGGSTDRLRNRPPAGAMCRSVPGRSMGLSNRKENAVYLAFRDIRAATGRFILIGSVVGLVTLLIVMLTGLTAGLGKQNTSALEALHPDRFIGTTGEDGSFSFTGSSVGQDAATTWAGTTGVDAVTPLGISQTRMTASDGGTRSTGSVAVFGLPAGTTVDGATVPADAVLLPADLRGITGDATSADLGGVDVPVASSTAPDLQYSHLPVALVDLGTWQAVAHTDDPTVLMADGSPADWGATAASTGTTALTVKDSFSGLSAYTSERGSLVAIQGLLYGISALVIVAFLSVWTIQRTRDIAVLRALGATKAYVFRDALGQAVVVVAAGVAVGALAGLGLGTVAGSMVPFSLSASTVVVPGLGVLILGVVGALVATRRVLSTDPRIAMEATS